LSEINDKSATNSEGGASAKKSSGKRRALTLSRRRTRGIAPQLVVKQPAPHIDRPDQPRPALKQDIHEAARRGAQVRARPAADHKVGPSLQSRQKLPRASAGPGTRAAIFERDIFRERDARLGEAVGAGENLARHDEPPRLVHGIRETALDDQLIETALFLSSFFWRFFFHRLARTCAAAPGPRQLSVAAALDAP
jgi:hypothetical protein